MEEKDRRMNVVRRFVAHRIVFVFPIEETVVLKFVDIDFPVLPNTLTRHLEENIDETFGSMSANDVGDVRFEETEGSIFR